MNTNETMKEVQELILKALRPFIGQRIDAKTRYNIRNAVLDLLQPYYENGTLDYIPLVDVNHDVEMSYLSEKIQKITMTLIEDGPNPSLEELRAKYGKRFTALRDVAQRNTIQIYLKDPDTFEPFNWPPRGNYDH